MGGGAGVHHPWRGAPQLHLLQRRNETRLVPCLCGLLVLLLLGWGGELQGGERGVGLLRSRSQHALTAGSAPRREADPRAGGSRPAGLLLLLLLVLLLLGATTSIAALLPAPALLLLLLRQLKMLLLRRRCSR